MNVLRIRRGPSQFQRAAAEPLTIVEHLVELRSRRAYIFVAIAVPLFVAGAAMAYFVVEKGLHFLIEAGIDGLDVQLEVTGYISFVATAMLVFALTVFAAFTTPDPGPFGMILLAGCLSSMFFIAVGVAFLNDRRRLKNDPYAHLADDEAAPLDDVDAAAAGSDVGGGR